MEDNETSCEPMDVDLSISNRSNSLCDMSISYPSPNLRRSHITEEIFLVDDYKYSELTNRSTSRRNFNCSTPVSFVSPVVIKKEKCDQVCDNENTDTQEEVTNKQDNSKKLEKIFYGQNRIQKFENNQQSYPNKFKITMCLVTLFIAILLYQLASFKCCQDLKLELFKQSLTTKLFGQSMAVEAVLAALESRETRKVITLYGGTGVGKTLCTSLLLENLLDYSNIYHYTMPSLNQVFSSELMLGITFCKSSLIVIDSLTKEDMVNTKEHIKELVAKSEKLSSNLTILLIYNCDITNDQFIYKCDNNFLRELEQSLVDINASKYFIKFVPLKEEHLRKCIQNEIPNKKLQEIDINNMVKNFNVTLDGCKGVHMKMKYLNVV